MLDFAQYNAGFNVMTPESILKAIEKNNPNFRRRPAQLEMIKGIYATLMNSVNRAAEEDQDGSCIYVADAGTGIGKSLSYLIGGLCASHDAKKRLIIASATISLQEQIVTKDIKILENALQKRLSVAIAKGRARFLCPLKLDDVTAPVNFDLFGHTLAPSEPTKEEQGEAQKLAERFASGAWSGDRDELDKQPDERVWASVSTDANGCVGRHRRHFNDCPYMKVRAQMSSADILVANHDLVLADLKMNGNILPKPEDAFLVLDEAHHFPRKAVASTAASHSLGYVTKWLDRVPALAERLLRVSGSSSVRIEALRQTISDLEMAVRSVDQCVSNYPEFQGVDENARHLPVVIFDGGVLPDAIHSLAEVIQDHASGLVLDLTKIKEGCGEAAKESGEVANAVNELGTYIGRIIELDEVWSLMMTMPQGRQVPVAKWLELHKYGAREYDITVNASPISAADRLCSLLWRKVSGAVLVSATLAVVGGFNSFLKRSGLSRLPKVKTVQFPSPFDYQSKARLVIWDMRSDPRNPQQHTREVIEVLPQIIDLTNAAGTLCLFASKRQMEEVYNGLPDRLRKEVLMQGKYVRSEIVRRHSQRILEKGRASVIFGLQSLGEGADFPGKLCFHVVIPKLPFDSPVSPVEKATSEWLKSLGVDPFMTIVVPEASSKLIQYAGRLLRTEEDFGTVTVLDKRLGTTKYGRMMLAALPPFSIEEPRANHEH